MWKDWKLDLIHTVAIVALALFWFPILSSCAHSIYITDNGQPIKQCMPTLVGISDDTPGKFHAPIVNAISYWEEATGVDGIFVYAGVVPFTIDSNYINGIVGIGVVSELKSSKPNTHPCGRTYIAWDSHNCIVKAKIRLNLECSGNMDEFQTVIRHEIGHVLGLDDSVDFTALMSHALEPTMQHPVDANEEEIRAVKALYKLK